MQYDTKTGEPLHTFSTKTGERLKTRAELDAPSAAQSSKGPEAPPMPPKTAKGMQGSGGQLKSAATAVQDPPKVKVAQEKPPQQGGEIKTDRESHDKKLNQLMDKRRAKLEKRGKSAEDDPVLKGMQAQLEKSQSKGQAGKEDDSGKSSRRSAITQAKERGSRRAARMDPEEEYGLGPRPRGKMRRGYGKLGDSVETPLQQLVLSWV